MAPKRVEFHVATTQASAVGQSFIYRPFDRHPLNLAHFESLRVLDIILAMSMFIYCLFDGH